MVETDGHNSQRRLLIVDDEETVRESMIIVLKDAGYDVVAAATGEEALELLKKESFKLQIIDLQLPGMTGLELCQESFKLDPVAVRLAVTGYASVFHLVQAREAGFDDYFVKPFDLGLLREQVDIAFHKVDRWRRGK